MPHHSPPENRLIAYLVDSGKTISTAESCSGGLIAHRLTNVPGASTPFIGGIVAYSNQVKMNLLAVPSSTLETHGAVSEETARAMAEGARQTLGTDLAIAVTGIAGPGGGTAEKPVGLVYMAVASAGNTRATKCLFHGDRESIKMQTADAALNLVWESLNS